MSALPADLPCAQVSPIQPSAPRDVESTGLSMLFIVELVTKTLFRSGALKLSALTERICLPRAVLDPVIAFMRRESLCEVHTHGAAETDVAYALTELGRRRAGEYLARCQYAGPAPVSLATFVEQVERAAALRRRMTPADMARAFADVVVEKDLVGRFGPALNSGRAVMLYGRAGVGKTFLAERLGRALPGFALVPKAIEVDGEVIVVFDPSVHQPVQLSASLQSPIERQTRDERWMLCRRPFVMAGGELTLQALDLQFDAATRFYVAPPQVKAVGGIFLVDDLGRQTVPATALLNRWIVPLERRIDFLGLHTGKRFSVPFDATVIFSSNLDPRELADEALLRRLGYKILVPPLDECHYRRILTRFCEESSMSLPTEVFDHLLELHAARKRPMLPSTARDLVAQIRDSALYLGMAPEVTRDAIEWAWANSFVESREEMQPRQDESVVRRMRS